MLERLRSLANNVTCKLTAVAPLRIWAIWVLVMLVGCYFWWLNHTKPAPKPGSVVTAQTSPLIQAMPRCDVQPKKVSVFKDKKAAVRKLGLSQEEAENDDEELEDAVDAPPSKYGMTTAVFVNLSTGKTRSVVKVNEAPWFRFERGNEIGAEVTQDLHGTQYQLDYARDVLSVKGVTLAVKAGGRYRPEAAHDRVFDPFVGARVKYSW